MTDQTEDHRKVYTTRETPSDLADILLKEIDSFVSKLETTEMERRRKIVRRAIRSNAIEGSSHGTDINPILDAYISGKIEASDIILEIKKLRGR